MFKTKKNKIIPENVLDRNDPIQARIFAWMPVIFTFLLATFPAGLVIYWTINNLLSIGQQWLIMRQTNKAK